MRSKASRDFTPQPGQGFSLSTRAGSVSNDLALLSGTAGGEFDKRAVFVLYELEGRSRSEVGEALGLSEGAVDALLTRARSAIREQLVRLATRRTLIQ